VRVGDRLTFDIGGERYLSAVASIRKVKWDSFQPNFFIVFAPGVIDNTRGNLYGRALTSGRPAPTHLPSSPDASQRLNIRYRRFSHACARLWIRLFSPCRAFSFFTVFAGLTVLLAAVQSSRDERRFESAMLRTLGASRKVVLQGVLAEFTVVGIAVGLLRRGRIDWRGYFGRDAGCSRCRTDLTRRCGRWALSGGARAGGL